MRGTTRTWVGATGVDVAEGDGAVVLEDDLGRDLAVGDLLEQGLVVGHGRGIGGRPAKLRAGARGLEAGTRPAARRLAGGPSPTPWPTVYVTRKAHFNAAHRLHNPDQSDEWNRDTFGKCNSPNWHGHNYELDVTVAGEPDPETGFVIDLALLKRVIEAEVLDPLDPQEPQPRRGLPRGQEDVHGDAGRRHLGPARAPRARPVRGVAEGDPQQLRRLPWRVKNPASRPTAPPPRAPLRYERRDVYHTGTTDALADLTRRQLELVGEDPGREGLVKTPERVAKAWQFLTHGYDLDPDAILESALFEEDHSQMVLVKDIEVYSLCEHHALPFFGKAHVAYIPNGRIVGLSKLPRVVDVFARRLQVQERLTIQVRDAVDRVLRPEGVAVVIEAQHLCMMMRGAEKQNSHTTTSAMSGVFLENTDTRAEFMRLIAG